jgi:hypothetical protein
VDAKTTCVDSKRQWRHASNVWHNSMIRSVLQTVAAPATGLARTLRHDKPAGDKRGPDNQGHDQGTAKTAA